MRPLAAALLALALLTPASLVAGDTAEIVQAARSYRAAHEMEILQEVRALLALPNRAADEEDIRRNAALLVKMLEKRGVEARLLESEGSPPAVFGELKVPGASKTVVLYAHYDGQPVERDAWQSDPFVPVLRSASLEDGGEVLSWDEVEAPLDPEWRIYARSASDDKSPLVAALAALDALRAAGKQPSVNLKFFLEGEEEVGSPHLEAMLRSHADSLQSNGWLFLDGPVHQSRRPQVVFGVRGVVDLEITLYGPVRPLHSGHYGNWAPNPAARLANLVASMRDADGRILIDGFYDTVRPLGEADHAALASVPDTGEALRRALAFGEPEGDGERLERRILAPALNVRGLASGQVGTGAKNAVPTEARVSIDFRLVPNLTPERVKERVEAHLRTRGFHLVEDEPDLETRRSHPAVARLEWGVGYRGVRTPLDLPISEAVLQIADEVGGETVIRQATAGGSLPMYLFEEILGAPLIVVPMVNHDNNQHAPNENLRLRNLWDGIELYAALIARLGEVWEP